MASDITQLQYDYAVDRIEVLLPLVTDVTPLSDPKAIELSLLSDVVIAYEKKHFPIEQPPVSALIRNGLEETGMTQKELAAKVGVSPSRISDYVSGRAEPTLAIARILCRILGISPSELLGIPAAC